jgi:uncharacterized membrane protein YphA (DoxX/SURF4 family)
MKLFVNISRILVGALFIFSGLVKAIDPLGLAYKMQEFFEVWAAEGYFKNLMNWLNNYATGFAIFMITMEVVLGVALLTGWQKKLTSWLLFLLTLFFTFLTAYVLFSGKIRACGCFGDCIPLTPVQTFTKDIVLTALIILILAQQKYIKLIFKKSIAVSIAVLALIAVLFLQFYVLKHLPLKDCLPYKPGNNILELRKMPKDAVQDKFIYSFVYKKAGVKKDFDVTALPDSSWEFVERKQTLVAKGKNNVPLINDFSFTAESGTDTTEAILNQQGEYYLLFVKEVQELKNPAKEFMGDIDFIFKATANGKKIYIITSDRVKAGNRYGLVIKGKKITAPVFTCDGTAIKTAARADITLYLMNGAVIKNKWAGADIAKALQ